ncbi:MAG: hypothetical protein U0229_25455 [Anaeromyxobacter sp.]
MKKLALAALVVPLAAFAQNPGQGPGPGGPGPGPRGPGMMRQLRDDPKMQERAERRMKLARTLGLAEALDLEPKKALELGDVMAKQDDRRIAIRKQMRDAHDVLRRAADGEKVSAQEVDQAIQKGLDARAQMAAVDKETLQAVIKDLNPEQRARAVLFLDRFHRRFAPGAMGEGLRQMIRQRMGPGGPGGQGAMMGGANGKAFAFAFPRDGADVRKKVVIAGPEGTKVYEGDAADDVLVDRDFAFDDGFDVEVEVGP